jgi:hypothetical protein
MSVLELGYVHVEDLGNMVRQFLLLREYPAMSAAVHTQEVEDTRAHSKAIFSRHSGNCFKALSNGATTQDRSLCHRQHAPW